MKIGFVTPEFVTEKTRGGQASYLENISKTLSKNGHEIFIIVLSDHDEEFIWEDRITVCRVKYHEVTNLDKIPKLNLLKRLYKSFWAFAGISLVLNHKTNKLFKEGRIELAQYSSLRAVPLFISKKNPSIIRLSAHPIYCRYAQEEQFNIEEAENNLSLSEKIWMASLKRADYIFGPSRMVGEAVARKIGRKVDIIESPFQSSNEMNEDEYHKYLAEKKYLLFFGTLSYIKGIQTIAPILDDFLDKYTDRYFVFLGKGIVLPHNGHEINSREYVLEYVKKHRDRVLFIDPIYNKASLNYIIYKSEACVLPSRMDNLPNTCVEAMALGKIVIGTNGASFEQLINDGESGYLCERDDPISLLRCMDKLMNMTEAQKKAMEMQAKLRTEEMSAEKICCQLCDVYEKVMSMYK